MHRARLRLVLAQAHVALVLTVPGLALAGNGPPPKDVALVSSSSDGPAIGMSAPDVLFESSPYGWHHLRDLWAVGGVVLVFEPSEEDLARMQQQVPQLAALHVTPLAVVRSSAAAAWNVSERLELSYSLLSDPGGVVAEAFRLDARDTAGAGTVWVVIDRSGTDRAVGYGPISAQDFGNEVSAALVTAPDPSTTVTRP